MRNSMNWSVIIGVIWTFSCSTPVQTGLIGTPITTPDIMGVPYYFSFSTEIAVSDVHHMTFKAEGQSFIAILNSDAGISATVVANGDFQSGMPSANASWMMDTDTDYVIGDQWMDVSTYNPADTSISSNGNLYFVRLGGYALLKLMIVSATPSRYNIKYAIGTFDGIFGSTQDITVPFVDAGTNFNFYTSAVDTTLTVWHMGITTEAVGATAIPVPSVVFNYDQIDSIAVITDRNFVSITSVPSAANWLESTQPLSYTGNYAVFQYDASGIPDEQITIKNPDYSYLIELTPGDFYKFRFVGYDSSLVKFEYIQL